ncbi:MAG TPA: hypothetical protein VD993_00370 [Chitinophagaceae bacterium]|nr:hypothetical protein [Chitinophagaceae bacterium]
MNKFQTLGKPLSRQEQKSIRGSGEDDDPGGGACYGTCIGSVGCWSYNEPVSWSTCLQDIQTYCSSGSGTCSVNYVCN